MACRLSLLIPQLIHLSQTGFVRNRNILDNLFSFWEVVALAKRTINKVVVVLLDFEKAYERVCWKFLESVMGKLSFQESWIKGYTRLYRNASNCVSLAGERGAFFQISRFVRSGCPLAPSKFNYTSKHSLAFSTCPI